MAYTNKKSQNLPPQTIVLRIADRITQRAIKQLVFEALPQTFNMVESSRDTLQHTPGGIFEDRWGEAAQRLSLTGVTPETPRKRGDKDVGSESRFTELRAMLRDYVGGRGSNASSLIKIRTDSNTVQEFNRSDVEMHILIFARTIAPEANEEVSNEWYRVHVPANYLTFNKAASARHTNFPYNLNLVLIGRLDSPSLLLRGDFSDIEEKADWIKRVKTAPGRVSDWMGSLDNLTEVAESSLDAVQLRARRVFATAGRLKSSVERALFLMDDYVTAIDRFVVATDSFIDFPYRSLNELQSITLRLYQSYSLILDEPDVFQGSIKDSLDFINMGLSKRQYFFEPLADADGREFRALQKVQITNGTTIEGLAVRYGIDSDEIIKLNNLAYPYILDGEVPTGADQFGKRVLRQGDILSIPQTGGARAEGENPFPESFTGRADSEEDRAYGVAWVLDEDGNMVGDSGRKGFLRVAGIENVKQALRIRMATEKASYLLHPSYGIERFIGKKATPVRIEILRADFQGQIKNDPRVEEVDNLIIESENGTMTATIKARLKNSATGETIRLDNLGAL